MTFGPDEERQKRQIQILQRCAGSKQERIAARKLFKQGVDHARTILVTALVTSGLSQKQAENLPGWLESVAAQPMPNELAAMKTLNELHYVAYYASPQRHFTCSLSDSALEQRALAWQAPPEPKERSRFEVLKLWRYCKLEHLVAALAASTARMGSPVTTAALELLGSHTDFWLHRVQPYRTSDSDLWTTVDVLEPLHTVAVHATGSWRQLSAGWLYEFARCIQDFETTLTSVESPRRSDCQLLNLLFTTWRGRGEERPANSRGETLGECASDLTCMPGCTRNVTLFIFGTLEHEHLICTHVVYRGVLACACMRVSQTPQCCMHAAPVVANCTLANAAVLVCPALAMCHAYAAESKPSKFI
jgi:hypothetical protein